MLEVFFLLFLPGRETANVHLVPIAWSALVRLSITAIFGERDGGRIFPHIITPIFTYSLGGEIGDGEGEVFLFSLSVPAIILIYVFSASPPSPFFLPLSPKRHPQDTTAERERKERKGQFSKIVFMGSLSPTVEKTLERWKKFSKAKADAWLSKFIFHPIPVIDQCSNNNIENFRLIFVGRYL